MIRKTAFLFLLIGCLIFITAGCSQSTEETAEKDKTLNSPAVEKISVPTEAPVLTGRIKEVIGNEITIYKIAAPDNREASPDREKPLAQMTAEEVRNNQSLAGVVNSQNTAGTSVLNSQETQETETLLIPAGAPIAGISTGDEGASALSLSDITVGSMIRVWKTESIITFVQVMGNGKARTQNAETNNMQMMPGGPPAEFRSQGRAPGSGNGSGISQSLGGGR